jgi:plastocyanin
MKGVPHPMQRHSNLRLAAAVGLSLAVLGILGLTSSKAPAESGKTSAIVAITDSFRFDPDTVTIHAGEAVEWKNQSHFRHTVTDDPKMAGQAGDAALPAGAEAFSSQEIPPGGSYRRMLSVPGTYRYFCMPHEGIGMLGKIIVLPAN